MNFILIAGAAALSASSVGAQTISLHPGETVTLRLVNGAAVVEQRGAAKPMTNFEIYTLWRAETQDIPPGAEAVPPTFVMNGEGPPNPPHPSGNTIQLTMRRVPGINDASSYNTALFILNGYDSALRYRAVMRSGDRSARTDVCDVSPHMLGLEEWPYSVADLDLSDLRLIEWSGTVQCQ